MPPPSTASHAPETHMRKKSKFPPGWNEERIRRVLSHYEKQSEAEAVAEDEALFARPGHAVMEVPHELVPVFRELIARHSSH